MDIKEAKKVLMNYANDRLYEINTMDIPVRRFYYEERRSLEKLIEILQYSI